MLRSFVPGSLCVLLVGLGPLSGSAADTIDLSHTTVVVREGSRPAAEKIAPTILIEEIAKRAGVSWPVSSRWPEARENSTAIALCSPSVPAEWQPYLPARLVAEVKAASHKAEGFHIRLLPADAEHPAIVLIVGNDSRGVMFGVGKLLRSLEWANGDPSVCPSGFVDPAPDRAIRGHQIGYRPTANSWDAWTLGQFEQYFRDMAIFGANSVESIPLHEGPSPLMKYDRDFMNVKFGELCEKYDLDHWAWIPIEVILPNPKKQAEFLKRQEAFFKSCRRLDAVFLPGGDPGDNDANDLLAFAERMAGVLRKYHPQATIWISLQRFSKQNTENFYAYLTNKKPDWYGGTVMGPSSPPMEITRQRTPKQYKLRWYPDITHIVRCQYEIPWLDPAWGVTLGREPVNPRPVDYAAIYQNDYRFTDGFLSYSDGIHDDFNKCLWSQLAWRPDVPPREVAIEYARYYFRPDLAEAGADGLLALESNLRGGILTNGSVDGTLLQWQGLERKLAGTKTNWRFDLHLFRAYYDAYTRQRAISERELELQALAKLGEAPRVGPTTALASAREILNQALSQPPHKEWRDRIEALGQALFESIGFQTSVPKYQASGSERGAVLDFLDYPLNDRWWLEDQFQKIAAMPSRAAQLERIDVIRNWENPGEGGYYDVIGHVARSPHIPKLLIAGDAMLHVREMPMPTQRWMREKPRPIRFAWHTYLNRVPAGITYTDLDPHARYTIKLFAQGLSPLLIDGEPALSCARGEVRRGDRAGIRGPRKDAQGWPDHSDLGADRSKSPELAAATLCHRHLGDQTQADDASHSLRSQMNAPDARIHQQAAVGFGRAADAYDRGRPDYPPSAVEHLVRVLNISRESRVVELGAGTGKFTNYLAATGARIIAVEPVASMRARLAERLPHVQVADATAEATSLAEASVDAVVAAQAFHWFDAKRAVGEIARILRAGGGLGLIWNVRDDSLPWVRRLTEIIDPHEGSAPRYRTLEWKSAFQPS